MLKRLACKERMRLTLHERLTKNVSLEITASASKERMRHPKTGCLHICWHTSYAWQNAGTLQNTFRNDLHTPDATSTIRLLGRLTSGELGFAGIRHPASKKQMLKRMLKTDAWQLEKECWRIAKYMEILDSMDVFCNLLSTKWMSERNNVLHGHT